MTWHISVRSLNIKKVPVAESRGKTWQFLNLKKNIQLRQSIDYIFTWTPGMSITNGSEGSLGKEERPSLVMAVTRNRYRMPDKILDSVHSVSSVVDTSIHSCKPRI